MLDVGKIVNEINVSFTYPDVNMSLYGFFGKIFGDNRCMFKCVQNFFDLKNQEAMENLQKEIDEKFVIEYE
jgi:DNA-binding transcriptional regulator GbsR (MarR family)